MGKNYFGEGFAVSLVFHLLLVFFLLSAGVGVAGKIGLEDSVEVTLVSYAPGMEKKTPEIPKQKPVAPRKPAVLTKLEEAKEPEIVIPERPEILETVEDPADLKKEEVLSDIKKKRILENLLAESSSREPEKVPAKTEEPATEREEPLEEKEREVSRDNRESSAQSSPRAFSLMLKVYYNSVSKQIEKHLNFPISIESREFLTALVSFRMNENGDVSDVAVDKSSGNEDFDSYCIKAVRESSPLPVPPNELRARIKSEPLVVPCEESTR